MKEPIIHIINNTQVIPVFYHSDIDTCQKVITACYKGGIRVFEYVNRGDAAIKNFPILKKYVRKNYPDMIFGAGSVLNQQQAEQFIQFGADFIVSPIISDSIAKLCIQNNTYWIPGCATPTEIAKAKEFGADIIKVFPGNVLGPGFIKSVLGPMPALKLMPTGGVEPTIENLKAWFDSGVVCVGMGSKLINNDMIDHPESLTKKVKEVIEIIKNIKD